MADHEESIRLRATDDTGATTEKVRKNLKTLEGAGKLKLSLLDHATEPIRRIGEQLKGLGKMAASMVVGGAFFQMGEDLAHSFEKAVGSVTEVGTAVSGLMFKTGESAETISGLLAVMEKMGVSSDAASTAVNRFSRGMQSVVNANALELKSTTGVIGALRNLGINVNDVHSGALGFDATLMKVADRFAQMPDGIAKTSAMLAIFGKSAGPEMIRFLNMGSKGIQEAEEAAKKYGLVLTNENIAKVREFGIAHKEFDEAIQGVMIQLGVAFLPMLSRAAEGAALFAQQFSENVMPTVQRLGELVAGPTTAAFELLSSVWKELMTWMQGTFLPRLHDLWEMLSPTRSWLGYALLWLTQTAWPQLLRAMGMVADWVKANLLPVLHELSDWLDQHVAPTLKALSETAWPALGAAAGSAGKVLQENVIPALSKAWDWLQKHQLVLAILKGALVGFGLAWLVSLLPIGAFVAAITTLSPLFGGLGAALALILTPLGLTLIVIGALAGAFIYLYNSSEEFRRAVDDISAAIQKSDWGALATELGKVKDDLLVFGGQVIMQTGVWTIALFEWVGNAIPPLLAALEDLGGKLGAWLGTEALDLAEQLGKWTGQFNHWVDTVAAQVPALMGRIGDAIRSWMSGTGQQTIQDAGAQMAGNFMDGLWKALTLEIPNLLGNFAELLKGGAGNFVSRFTSGFQQGNTGSIVAPVASTPGKGFQSGGWLTEPIAGVGLDTGRRYNFVENRKPEYVVPSGGTAPGGGGSGVSLTVAAGAVQISGAAGPAQGWADAADSLWEDLNTRLQRAMGNRPLGLGRST